MDLETHSRPSLVYKVAKTLHESNSTSQLHHAPFVLLKTTERQV